MNPMLLKRRIQTVLEQDYKDAHAVNSRYIKIRANGDAGMIVIFTEDDHTACHDANLAMHFHRCVVDLGANFREDLDVVVMTTLAIASRIRGPAGATASQALQNQKPKRYSTGVFDVGICVWIFTRKSTIVEKIKNWGCQIEKIREDTPPWMMTSSTLRLAVGSRARTTMREFLHALAVQYETRRRLLRRGLDIHEPISKGYDQTSKEVRLRADTTPGAAVTEAARRKRTYTYPEFAFSPRCRFGLEIGGRWANEAVLLLRHLARAKARDAADCAAAAAWNSRWATIALIAVARALAASLARRRMFGWTHPHHRPHPHRTPLGSPHRPQPPPPLLPAPLTRATQNA